MFPFFPTGGRYASPASSVMGAVDKSRHAPTSFHTRHGSRSILSTWGLHYYRNWEQRHNTANPGHNNMSSTIDFARDATTNYSRKRGLYPNKEWHKHLPHRVMASYPVVFQIHRVAVHQAADQGEHHHIPVP